jgi:hypothetical protein
MTEPGLRIESAASVTARDMIEKHVRVFNYVIRHDRAANQSTVAAYVDGLAAVAALTIIGGHGGHAEVVEATVKALRDAINRDLMHLGRGAV